jgi:hypothetical protein
MPKRDSVRRGSEADRYKKAATDALALVDWCIEYLADNHRGDIARQLARNRRLIGARLEGRHGRSPT